MDRHGRLDVLAADRHAGDPASREGVRATVGELNYRALGYAIPAASEQAWRTFDRQRPSPGYFEFDWLSARHPDLYHRFALSTDALIRRLPELVPLEDREVVDVGAGTGRSAVGLAHYAKHVHAIDVYASVVTYGAAVARRAQVDNVQYIRADRSALPLRAASVDIVACTWAELDYREAGRVLRPGGVVVHLGPAPGSLCGELTPALANAFPELITQVAPPWIFDAACPSSDGVTSAPDGIAIADDWHIHDFTDVVDYGDVVEAATMLGRLYGPPAEHYVIERGQSTVAWRLRIQWGHIADEGMTTASRPAEGRGA